MRQPAGKPGSLRAPMTLEAWAALDDLWRAVDEVARTRKSRRGPSH